MTLAQRPLIILGFIIAGLAAGASGYLVRAPIERALFLRAARELSGLSQLDVSTVERERSAYRLTDLRAATPDGAAAVVAPLAYVNVAGTTIDLELHDPHFTFDPLRYRDSDRLGPRDALARWHSGAAEVNVNITGGTLGVGDAGAPPVLTVDAIDGAFDIRPDRALYEGNLVLIHGGARYDIEGRKRDQNGMEVQGWRAARLPVAAFAPFFSADAIARPVAGRLHDLDVTDGPLFRATAWLEGGTVALGSHALHDLHGNLVAVGDGVGSSRIAGFLDGASFEAAGEVHDLHSHYRWLQEGTNDLRALAELATAIVSDPRVQGPVRLEATAPGLGFAQYATLGDHGPLVVSLLSVDPLEPTLRFDTAIASDHIVSGGERTSAMGVRTGAVAGVNGDYFDIGRTYQPQGMLVRSGSLVHGPTDRAVLSIDASKHVTFGEFRMRGEVKTARGTMAVTEFNAWPPGNVAVITPAYGAQLGPANATFISLSPLKGRRYRVVGVSPGTQPIPVRFGIAVGPKITTPLPHAGETIEVSYGTDPPLAGAIAAIGGGPILLRDGEWFEDPHAPAPDERDVRWPVIALARLRDDRLMLVAVDGRHPERSVGMTRPEFADMLVRLGGVDAMALDSGGSVTLVARAPGDRNVSVRNVPSDSSAERWVSDALFLYSVAPAPTIVRPLDATMPVAEVRPAP